jgi:hypothetical protein
MTNRCMPGLGQGHGKKRHLHAHSPVNFKELKCYKDFTNLLTYKKMVLFIKKRIFQNNI